MDHYSNHNAAVVQDNRMECYSDAHSRDSHYYWEDNHYCHLEVHPYACRNIPRVVRAVVVVPQGVEAHHNVASPDLAVVPVALGAGHPYCYTSYAVAVPLAGVAESNFLVVAPRPLGEVVVLEKVAVGLPTPSLTDLLDWGH